MAVFSVDWTTVTHYLQDFRGQPSPHYSESRMLLRDSFCRACHHVTMSARHWLTYTGCRFAIGSTLCFKKKFTPRTFMITV